MLDDNAILVGDVGQNQIWVALNYKVTSERKFFISGGLGPWAIVYLLLLAQL